MYSNYLPPEDTMAQNRKLEHFHIVRFALNGRCIGHAIYKDNIPFLIEARGNKLSRQQARDICMILNGNLANMIEYAITKIEKARGAQRSEGGAQRKKLSQQ